MPIDECRVCGGAYQWRWTEAFEKFGFGDGDGQIETCQVQEVLEAAGYAVQVDDWGLHNCVIVSIKQDDTEHIPHEDPTVTFGYDDPRTYLPDKIVDLLDGKLPD